MGDSALGNGLLEQWLEEVRAAIELEGELTEAAIAKVVQGFGGNQTKSNQMTRNGTIAGLEDAEVLALVHNQRIVSQQVAVA